MNLRAYLTNSRKFTAEWEGQEIRKQAKILGIKWNIEDNTIQITFPQCQPLFNNKIEINKRVLLHTIASLYEPLGLYQPVILCAKLYSQELWQKNYDWVEKLDQTDRQNWLELMQNWTGDTLNLTRKITIENNMPRYDLHVFVDASTIAFAACAYLISYNTVAQAKSEILFVKTRLNPTKKLTVPRLELLAI